FQAEDGIRDFHVTGVQTCALPIWGEGGSRRSGQWGMTRARALHTVPWVQSVFAPRSGLLLWRPAAFPGSAFDELTFCRFEVGEILSVAVGGDVLTNDV